MTEGICERLRLVDKSIWLSSGLADSEKLMVGEWSHEAADLIDNQQKEIDQLKGMVLNLLSKEFEHVKVIKPKK